MIRSIPLILTNVDEAQDLLPVDDECRRPGDVISCESETVIDTVTLDDRTIRVGEDRHRQPLGLSVRLNFFGALADNHVYFGPQRAVG
jgi:hypothetical protein